jgi:hypothetical protein
MQANQIAFMQAGTLGTTPAGIIVMGITNSESLKTSRFRGIKIDHQDQELPNQKNVALSAVSSQCSIYQFMTLISYRGGNCDIQIITGEGKVFKFPAATYPLGIKPKLTYNKDERIITVDIEGAFPQTVWNAIVTAADSAAAIDLGFDPDSGADYTKTREVYPMATESPISTAIISPFIERSLVIEPKEKAKGTIISTSNISLFDKMIATIDLTIEDVTLAEYAAQEAKGASPSLLWKEGNGGALYDAFSFAAGKLVQSPDIDEDGNKNTMVVQYKGSFPIASMVGTYGTSHGGEAADSTGTTGGTITIS